MYVAKAERWSMNSPRAKPSTRCFGNEWPHNPPCSHPLTSRGMKLESVRKHALSLEAVSEEPHHTYSSFRVRGKIFVTIPPDEAFIHIFVGEQDRETALALYPEFIEKLFWGSKVLGLRVCLATAKPAVVQSLVSKAYDQRVRKDAGPKLPRKRGKPA